MKLETTIGVLRDFVCAIEVLCMEVNLSFDEEGMRMRGVDPAYVAFIRSLLRRNAFKRYEFSTNEEEDFPLTLSVDIEVLDKFLKLGDRDDGVTIDYSFSDRGKSISVMLRDLRRRVALGDSDWTSTPKDPIVACKNFTHTFGMKTSNLKWILKAMNLTSINVSLRADDESVSIIDSTLPGEMKTWTKIPGDFRIDGKKKDWAKSHFPLDYVTNVISGTSADDIQITFGQDYPLKLEYDIESNGKKVGKTAYLIAPTILD